MLNLQLTKQLLEAHRQGNLDPRGDAYDPANGAGVDLTERTLSTKKLNFTIILR